MPSLKPGQFPDATFDFALIDGVEGYAALKQISETLYPMMKIDGHVAFHDYEEGRGVKQAVRSFVLRYTDLAGRVDRLQVCKVA